ncbi:MAG TPA: FTR1 family protein [Gemmatimonadales bacterium]|nr:FTR1 family protein [Gemmatimonadales bacterium]
MFLGFVAAAALFQAVPQPDVVALARRIAASAELAVAEYRVGVVGGEVVAAAEVDEARLFLGEARRTAVDLPASVRDSAMAELALALSMVDRIAAPDSIGAVVARFTGLLRDGLGIVLVEIPSTTPSLARGGEIYDRECAMCHGGSGGGDGPAGTALDPPPANLADFESLLDVTPLAFYQRITIGVAGTAMPAYEGLLDPADRWAVALYASTLRQAAAQGEVPDQLTSFARTAELNDEQILAMLGEGATRGQLAAVRSWQDTGTAGFAATFTAVRQSIDEAVGAARTGSGGDALSKAMDAYLQFESVERTLQARNPGLVARLESSFAALREAGSSADVAGMEAARTGLLAGLEQAERLVADRPSSGSMFTQSLMILLREGIEAILIIGALLAFLVKVGAPERRRDIHIGVAAAVLLSLVTAVLIETVFRISPAHQEVLEGITMLTAVVVLFYVSYWLLSRIEVAKWTSYVRQHASAAVAGGSAFALASAAFLAVYREGFETVLFYQALFLSGGPGSSVPVVAGIGVGAVILAAIYVAINRYGVRLPLKPFFAVTSAFLYYTAFVFAGKGVAELQAGGAVPTTVLPGWPRFPVAGVYPTRETMLAQGVLIVLAVIALVVLVSRRGRPQPAAAA